MNVCWAAFKAALGRRWDTPVWEHLFSAVPENQALCPLRLKRVGGEGQPWLVAPGIPAFCVYAGHLLSCWARVQFLKVFSSNKLCKKVTSQILTTRYWILCVFESKCFKSRLWVDNGWWAHLLPACLSQNHLQFPMKSWENKHQHIHLISLWLTRTCF